MLHVPGGLKGHNLEQNICTPYETVEPLYRHIGGCFSLDAFCGRATRCKSIIEALYAVNYPREDGLEIRWWGHVWGNPPFRKLGAALRKAWLEVCVAQNAVEAFIHGPFRSHRKYWKFFWRAQAVCYVTRTRYVGYDDDYPLPTVVVYYGPYAERFMRFMAPLGVVRPLTPWHARHIMTEMNVSEEYEARLRSVLVDTARAHPELSLTQLRDQLQLDEDDWHRLLSTPIADFAVGPELAYVEPPANDAPQNGARNGARPKAKKKAPPRAPKGDGDAIIEKIIAKKKKGDRLKTSDLMKATGLGRNTILRKLESYKQIKPRGSGRGAYLEVTK